MVVKRLPAFIRFFLACLCGIGVVEKKPEIISYKKIKKSIALNHPVDPLTGEKFSIVESITVANYNLKLADAFGCIRLNNFINKIKAKCFNFILKKKDRGITKPESMKDVPDDDKEDSF